MSSPVRDGKAMISGMSPELNRGRFVFCTSNDRAFFLRCANEAIATYREEEGMSLILPVETAERHGLDTSLTMACITLTVTSSLEGIGLTAAVAEALAMANIPCNVVAAYHHDHVFVPAYLAQEALDVLRKRAAKG
ncbi:ACT domain-containing protein [Albibacillus kandeliae]|uniref:ACT domain-containing protein n=1 Tax=Albibacillus kandeliae TaxID=2174228 RepID=UPI000D68E652|nr:ACT domain-containing protein [Albibacillus kandeliae]